MYHRHVSTTNALDLVRAPPVVGTPSPFVQFSSATMEEHQNTLDRLNAQLEMIARALADLEGEEARHHNEHSRTVETLAREQDEIIRRSYQCRDMAGSLAAQMQEEEGRMEAELGALGAREGEVIGELRQLEDLEQEMMELERSARDRLHVTQTQIAMFTQALREGLDVLETDANEVRRIITTAGRTFSNDPIGTSHAMAAVNMSGRRSPLGAMRGGSAYVPPPPMGTTSPFRDRVNTSSSSYAAGGYGYGAHTSALPPSSSSPFRSRPASPSMMPSAVGPASPTRGGRHSRFMEAAHVNQTSMAHVANHNTSSTSLIGSQGHTPQQQQAGLTIPGSQELLSACARVPMDPNEVTFLLRQSQAAVNGLDQLDNTPLHIACMNPSPSLDAIHALLLAGANTSLKNTAGLTPFHLACLNCRGDTAADDHKLKRFLVFKGAQNPNQRTSRGETAAHLCAEDDKHFDSLVFLVGAGVDAAIPALLSGPNGESRQMNAIDVARAGGPRSAKNAQFLSVHCAAL